MRFKFNSERSATVPRPILRVETPSSGQNEIDEGESSLTTIYTQIILKIKKVIALIITIKIIIQNLNHMAI